MIVFATILTTAIVALLAFAYWLAGKVLFPPTDITVGGRAERRDSPPVADPGGLSLDFENVEFPTEDGFAIRGWFIPGPDSQRRAVIAIPGGGGRTRRDYLPFARQLHDAGLALLFIDPRSQGKSDTDPRGNTLGRRESLDVAAAARWLQDTRNSEAIGAIGISQGAASAFICASRSTGLKAIVVMGFGYDLSYLFKQAMPFLPVWYRKLIAGVLLWRQGLPIGSAMALRYPQLEAARHISQPTLFIHGSADTIQRPEVARDLARKLHGVVEFWEIEGLGHEMPTNLHPEIAPRRIAEFFDEHL